MTRFAADAGMTRIVQLAYRKDVDPTGRAGLQLAIVAFIADPAGGRSCRGTRPLVDYAELGLVQRT